MAANRQRLDCGAGWRGGGRWGGSVGGAAERLWVRRPLGGEAASTLVPFEAGARHRGEPFEQLSCAGLAAGPGERERGAWPGEKWSGPGKKRGGAVTCSGKVNRLGGRRCGPKK